MDKITIEEGNRLIAVFDDMEIFTLDPDYGEVFYSKYDKYKINRYPVHELKYHSSWDWLMPVVEKIGFHNFDIFIQQYVETKNGKKYNVRACRIEDSYKAEICFVEKEELLITSTWKAVIKFIQWYNKQKQ